MREVVGPSRRGAPWRLLILYHAAAAFDARKIFGALAKTEGMALTVVGPAGLQVSTVYEASGALRIAERQRVDGYELLPIPLRDASSYWSGFEEGQLKGVLRAVRPHVIHALDEPISGYLHQVAWLRLTCSPRSRVLFYGFENVPFRLGRRKRWHWLLTWRLLAGGACANSEAARNLASLGFPRNRPVERIFWGIPQDVFRPMDRSQCRRELGLDVPHLVGYVGRLLPEKGLQVLRSALGQLPAAVHCLVIGSGPMQSELESWSAAPELAGRLHLRPAMAPSAVARHMSCMDGLVLPSLTTERWKEQFGRVLAEAMACGVPVIGSDSGAIPEVIGDAGTVVPEGDAAALAEAVRQTVLEPASVEAKRQAGLARVADQLSSTAMARRLVALYRRVLGG